MKNNIKFKGMLITLIASTFLWGAVSVGGLGGCGTTKTTTTTTDDGGGVDSEGTGTTTGTASVASLTTVPSADLSTLDNSLSSSASALQAALSLQAVTVNDSPQNLEEARDAARAVGGPSRAGCESDAHKKEIFRESQISQLSRCYLEAMERAGLITIPTDGTRAAYLIAPPDVQGEETGKFCDDIPAERVDEKKACEGGEAGAPEVIKARLGVINNCLEVDLGFGPTAAAVALEEESTFCGEGTLYTISTVHKGNWNGNLESSSFSMTVDIGTDGSVTNGLVTLGSAGSAVATANHVGGFGSGFLAFEASGAKTNLVKGAFKGDFTDPFSNTKTSFTGKAIAKFNATEGAARFSFTGSMPPMSLGNMVPYDISAANLNGFLSNMSRDICGLTGTLDSTNYRSINLCITEGFDPANANATGCAMTVLAAGETCGEVTHEGVECFTISNGSTRGDYATKVTQAFLRKACDSNSDFFKAVDAFDMSTLSTSITTPAFARNWDFSGDITTVDFSSMTEEGGQKMMGFMTECFAIEEKVRDNEGMGGHNCGGEEMGKIAEGHADAGPPTHGKFGGDLKRTTNNCAAGGSPGHIFIETRNSATNSYCIPTPDGCSEFIVAGTPPSASNLSITMPPHLTMTALQYTQSGTDPATALNVTFGAGTCVESYTIEQQSFSGPGEFGEPPPGGGGPGGGGGGPPQICIDTFGANVTEAQCDTICRDPAKASSCRS